MSTLGYSCGDTVAYGLVGSHCSVLFQQSTMVGLDLVPSYLASVLAANVSLALLLLPLTDVSQNLWFRHTEERVRCC
jgi:hypothetical protein